MIYVLVYILSLSSASISHFFDADFLQAIFNGSTSNVRAISNRAFWFLVVSQVEKPVKTSSKNPETWELGSNFIGDLYPISWKPHNSFWYENLENLRKPKKPRERSNLYTSKY